MFARKVTRFFLQKQKIIVGYLKNGVQAARLPSFFSGIPSFMHQAANIAALHAWLVTETDT
jgi:hypothetical protein